MKAGELVQFNERAMKAMSDVGIRIGDYRHLYLWNDFHALGGDTRSAEPEEMLRAIYALAVDKLTDEDGRFNIRRYFMV